LSKTCESCKYFTRNTQNPNFGTCGSGKVIYVASYRILIAQPTDVLVLSADDTSDPIIGKDYGCIHHDCGT